MSSADCKDEQCQNNLNKIYSDLLHLITSFEKGSGSELTVRLRQVESGLEQLRESVRSIPDIQNNEQRQKQRIASLYRQIKLKDELIQSFLHYDIVDGSERVNIKRD
ncbi:hypothetical protein KIN20_025411 [Parelaphostrongylus tenuis]|uniref:Mediator of RNA polymerase II transcription subunit 9 n=1 Tax=Parelaphostrongylus tenuis TaxID=148309 RepID=A0AAD5MV95_PARTN|nr:hypothetical protein KIN20_025411 [Parelaphostrongylus tenuis]